MWLDPQSWEAFHIMEQTEIAYWLIWQIADCKLCRSKVNLIYFSNSKLFIEHSHLSLYASKTDLFNWAVVAL